MQIAWWSQAGFTGPAVMWRGRGFEMHFGSLTIVLVQLIQEVFYWEATTQAGKAFALQAEGYRFQLDLFLINLLEWLQWQKSCILQSVGLLVRLRLSALLAAHFNVLLRIQIGMDSRAGQVQTEPRATPSSSNFSVISVRVICFTLLHIR